jgi:peptidoglycan glycosyltransferase
VGPEQMIETAQLFGFNQLPPIDLPNAATSRFPIDYGMRLADVDFYRGGEDVILANGAVGVYENSARLAQTSIGQNDVAATPLQMALVAAAIANNGQIMVPYVVQELTGADGASYQLTKERLWRQAMRLSSADVLRAAMVEVAINGTARNMAVDGLMVGGKTGTAQLGTDPPNSHAWIIGFAGTGDGVPELAIAVIVEAQEGASEQTGGAVAAPIARAVIEAYFS